MRHDFFRHLLSCLPQSVRTSARRFLPVSAKRCISRILANSAPEGSTITVDDGRVFRVTKDRVFWRVFYERMYEPDLTAVIRKLIQRDDHTVDVGANFGWYTTLFAQLAPKGLVNAYEPVPNVFRVLEDNVGLNGYSQRVRRLNVCVGDHAGEVSFHSGARESGLAHIADHEPNADTIVVPMTTLDDDLRECTGRIAVVKIDAEGAEWRVLTGGKTILDTNDPPILVVEINHEALARAGTDPKQVLEFLKDRRYRLWRINRHGVLQEFDGNVSDNAICAAPGIYGDRLLRITRQYSQQ